jgi:outer membrane cobalamin receptor
VRDYGNGNNSFADVILEDYFTVDYSLKYDLLNYGQFYMNINNVFNNNYEQAFMYSSMGRDINIGLRMVY